MWGLRLIALFLSLQCYALAALTVVVYLNASSPAVKVFVAITAIVVFAVAIWHSVHIFCPDWLMP